MAAKQFDMNRVISNACKGKELENEIENESETEVDGSESHVDGDGAPKDGTSLVIKNVHSFAANVLPIYFKHNFQSFMPQLNPYGFKKISWEKWEYKNKYFRKEKRNLLKNIKRKDHCSRRNLPSLDTKSSCSISISMENELIMLTKEHHQVKAD
ncbi:hypothetical protein ACS0TY_020720 [Phlomoides rotata]